MNVYLGNVAAGATWPLPWEAFQKEHPDMARKLELKWETEPMINVRGNSELNISPNAILEGEV